MKKGRKVIWPFLRGLLSNRSSSVSIGRSVLRGRASRVAFVVLQTLSLALINHLRLACPRSSWGLPIIKS